jgi:hypothetical protein
MRCSGRANAWMAAAARRDAESLDHILAAQFSMVTKRTLLDERLADLEWNPRCAESVVRSQSSAWAAVPLTLPGLIRRAAESDFGDRRTSGLAP